MLFVFFWVNLRRLIYKKNNDQSTRSKIFPFRLLFFLLHSCLLVILKMVKEGIKYEYIMEINGLQ